jgi:hypothetical protein
MIINYSLEFLKTRGIPTVDDYVQLNWPGMTFDQLEGEDRADVEDLIAEGELYVETPGSARPL